MPLEKEKKPELKSHTIALMAGVALTYDVLQALLNLIAMGWILVPVAYLHFWLWFKLHGASFFTIKRVGTFGISAILEVATAGILPATTFNVLVCALDYKVKKAL